VNPRRPTRPPSTPWSNPSPLSPSSLAPLSSRIAQPTPSSPWPSLFPRAPSSPPAEITPGASPASSASTGRTGSRWSGPHHRDRPHPLPSVVAVQPRQSPSSTLLNLRRATRVLRCERLHLSPSGLAWIRARARHRRSHSSLVRHGRSSFELPRAAAPVYALPAARCY